MLTNTVHHQSSERIFAEPGIEPVTSGSQVIYDTDLDKQARHKHFNPRTFAGDTESQLPLMINPFPNNKF